MRSSWYMVCILYLAGSGYCTGKPLCNNCLVYVILEPWNWNRHQCPMHLHLNLQSHLNGLLNRLRGWNVTSWQTSARTLSENTGMFLQVIRVLRQIGHSLVAPIDWLLSSRKPHVVSCSEKTRGIHGWQTGWLLLSNTSWWGGTNIMSRKKMAIRFATYPVTITAAIVYNLSREVIIRVESYVQSLK